MFLVSILVAMYVFVFVQSTPTSTYQRKEDFRLAERPEFLLFNQIPGIADVDMFEPGNIEGGGGGGGRNVLGNRVKRLGSLSIVNPLDVLRERVLLELVRRKMRQNQRQVDANRKMLDSIGKRAISNENQYRIDSNEDPIDSATYASTMVNDYLYGYHRLPGNDLEADALRNQHRQLTSNRGTERRQVWETHGEDPVIEESENDETRRMATELNLL